MKTVAKNIEHESKLESEKLKIKCLYYAYLPGYYVNVCTGYLTIEVNIMQF